MIKKNDILLKAGLQPLGLCSTLWVDEQGQFRGGLFRYNDLLHLVVLLSNNLFWITQVSVESVEICFRKGASLYVLSSKHNNPHLLKNEKFIKAKWLDRIRLWWILRINRTELLPNYYYLWNEYCFSDKSSSHG